MTSVATIPFPNVCRFYRFWESSVQPDKGEFRDLLESSNATVYLSRTDNRSGFRDNGIFRI